MIVKNDTHHIDVSFFKNLKLYYSTLIAWAGHTPAHAPQPTHLLGSITDFPFALIVIADLFSGIGIPLVFFPKLLLKVSSVLPFQYISDLPFRIYVGNIPVSACLKPMIIQFVWLILLILIGQLLLRIIIKRVEVQGG